MEFIEVSVNSNLTKRMLNRGMRYEDAVVFLKEDKKISSKYLNRPLYVTASVHDVELDVHWWTRFLYNIILLSTLEAMWI